MFMWLDPYKDVQSADYVPYQLAVLKFKQETAQEQVQEAEGCVFLREAGTPQVPVLWHRPQEAAGWPWWSLSIFQLFLLISTFGTEIWSRVVSQFGAFLLLLLQTNTVPHGIRMKPRNVNPQTMLWANGATRNRLVSPVSVVEHTEEDGGCGGEQRSFSHQMTVTNKHRRRS